MTHHYQAILAELGNVLDHVSDEETTGLIDALRTKRRIFISGAGRTKLMMKAFTVRLVHLGLEVYVIGDVTTPSAQAGDVLIVGTGSGNTTRLYHEVMHAKTLGVTTLVLTAHRDSSIGRVADHIVQLPIAKKNLSETEHNNFKQPMGSLFEQALLLYLDNVVLRLMKTLTMTEDDMVKRHANLE